MFRNGGPFVKWAGGKRSLVSAIRRCMPALGAQASYHEPFLGGGALFFACASTLQQAHLSDINEALIEAYCVVREQVDDLIELLREHAAQHSKAHYYKVRDQGEALPRVARAARLIYLNRSCYNGLYRVNRAGGFNVPMGSYANPEICNEPKLCATSQALHNASIKVASFDQCNPQRGDFVYCDPPYDGTYTSYTPGGFDRSDQERLCAAANSWRERGARVCLSNADTPLIRDLYADWSMESVRAPRPINRNGNGRQAVGELILMSDTGMQP